MSKMERTLQDFVMVNSDQWDAKEPQGVDQIINSYLVDVKDAEEDKNIDTAVSI